MVPLVGTFWGLPFPASGNPRQEYAAHIDEPSVLPRRRAKKRTNQIRRFNLFFMVPLVGTLWGLPFPASGNPRQEYATHIDEPSVLPRRRAKKEQTKSKDLICSLWCRWSVPFGDCRFPQAGTLGKNMLRILTNLRFSPDVGQKKNKPNQKI